MLLLDAIPVLRDTNRLPRVDKDMYVSESHC
ncbi:hypothetical protein EDF82_4878 [Raoultella sp. BIGb0399]|nr:hypothetical protein EDF82_4878 [Raoultella sp. BIGb0399]